MKGDFGEIGKPHMPVKPLSGRSRFLVPTSVCTETIISLDEQISLSVQSYSATNEFGYWQESYFRVAPGSKPTQCRQSMYVHFKRNIKGLARSSTACLMRRYPFACYHQTGRFVVSSPVASYVEALPAILDLGLCIRVGKLRST